MNITATRYHDISCGHRVVGHEGKCAHLHGHNYRITFTCAAERLDVVGRVIDFSVIKEKLCLWLEDNWDHKFLAWGKDDLIKQLARAANACQLDAPYGRAGCDMFHNSIVWTIFNPTAENMAVHLLSIVGPQQLIGTGVKLVSVVVEETRKCSAEARV